MKDDWKGEDKIRVTPDPHAARGMNLRPAVTRPPRPKASNAAIADRRAKIKPMILRGDSMVRVAVVLGLSYHTIYEDCKVMEILPSRKSA